MHLRQVKINNIKSFESIELDLSHGVGRYAGWTVVAGPNAAGKTTLLRAIGLACVGPTTAMLLQENAADWIRKSFTKATVEVVLDRGPRDAVYLPFGVGGAFDLVESREPFRVGLEWMRHSNSGEPSLKPINQQVDDRAMYGPWLHSDQTPGWFIAGYGAYRRLSGGSVDSQRITDSSRRSVAQLASLFREDTVLAETFQWLQRFHLLRLEGRGGAGALIDGVLGLLNSGLLPGHAIATRLDSDGLWIQRTGTELPLQQLSHGYQTVTGLVVDLIRQLHASYDTLRFQERDGIFMVENEGVVLIDEMETHLHPAWQKRVGFWFKEHFPNMQFIVTTHSPFICQAADPGGLIHLPSSASEGSARKIEGREFESIVNGTADDALLSELFGLEHARSEVAESLLNEVAELESRILSGSASKRDEARFRELRDRFPPSSDIQMTLRAINRDD